MILGQTAIGSVPLGGILAIVITDVPPIAFVVLAISRKDGQTIAASTRIAKGRNSRVTGKYTHNARLALR
jgi:hypothetical protein